MAPFVLEAGHAAQSPAPILSSGGNTTTLKYRVASGETLYGLFLMSASPTIAEIAGLAGYDFVVVDMEHGSGGISDALSCIRALAAAGTPAIIRVPEKSAAWAKKALDLGPQGIMFPMVENGKIAEQVVSYCRYPPRGIRGTAHVMVRASGYGTDDTYVHRCEEELLILCMVETEAGVDNIEAIAAVDGVDGIQMGPRDLGASMGYLKDPGNPKAREVLQHHCRWCGRRPLSSSCCRGCVEIPPWGCPAAAAVEGQESEARRPSLCPVGCLAMKQ